MQQETSGCGKLNGLLDYSKSSFGYKGMLEVLGACRYLQIIGKTITCFNFETCFKHAQNLCTSYWPKLQKILRFSCQVLSIQWCGSRFSSWWFSRHPKCVQVSGNSSFARLNNEYTCIYIYPGKLTWNQQHIEVWFKWFSFSIRS